jgi:hypothetical protein
MTGTPDPLASIAAAAGAPLDAPDLRPSTGAEAGDDLDVAELGDDCPVQPLGFLKQKMYFLDVAGQLIELGTEMRKGELIALFGTRAAWLDAKWPQWKKVGERTGPDGETVPIFEPDTEKGFNQAKAQRGLILACHKRRLFDPKGKVRGRGAHLGDDGELVLHCGDHIIVGGRKGVRGRLLKTASFKPGLVGSHVYPTAPAIAPPAEAPAPIHIGAQVLTFLKSWNWKRKEIDAYLLLCWLATACLGGALRNRPHGWITGPSGAGKTTLQDFLRQLMDDWAIFTEDATEAGVRQLLDQDTLAVMFDEIEPDEGNADVHMKIVKLARLAYSGGSGLRGGQDHVSKQFVARSCFLFSSIHHHELPPQDRNRIAILHLSKFPKGTAQLVMPAMLKDWGAQIRRRLVEQWPRYKATLAAYQTEMLRQGYAGREQDTYGTLLACGDLLLHDEAPPEPVQAHLNGMPDRCAELVDKLARVLDSVRAEAEDTTERALKFLTSRRLPAAGGKEQVNVGRWIEMKVIEAALGEAKGAAASKLLTHGLRVVHLAPDHDKDNGQGGLAEAVAPATREMFLAIANGTNQGMAELFADSTWRGGIWNQAFALAEGAIVNKKSRFGGRPEGCVLVPLAEAIDVDAALHEAQMQRMAREAEQRGA